MDPIIAGISDSFAGQFVLVVLSVVLTATTAIFATNFYNRRQMDAARDLRIVEIEKQIALISASVVPISTAFEAVLIKQLTHLHTPRLDDLMTRIGPPSSLLPAEVDEMADLLRERAIDMGDRICDSERDAAVMLPLVMKRARIEADDPIVIVADGALLQLVSTPNLDNDKDAGHDRQLLQGRPG
jgi:hypothetical protein